MQVEIRDEVKAVFDSFGMTDLNAIIENEAVMMQEPEGDRPIFAPYKN